MRRKRWDDCGEKSPAGGSQKRVISLEITKHLAKIAGNTEKKTIAEGFAVSYRGTEQPAYIADKGVFTCRKLMTSLCREILPCNTLKAIHHAAEPSLKSPPNVMYSRFDDRG